MTILEIMEAVAKNVGVSVPTVAVTATETEYVNLLQFCTETAEELARRVDWSALRNTTTITGTGSNDSFALPAGFDRLTMGGAVTTGGNAVRGGLTQDEWFSLTAAEGTPRFFRINGTASINFHPYPANGTDVLVSYQSKNWCDNGTAAWSADDDEPLVPADLVVKGAIWRWKRKLSQDFSDYLAEYEATLADRAGFDMRERTP